MADLRIVDAPEIPTENITGEEKLPTGGSGNYSITLDSVADYTKTKKNLADNTSVDGKVNGVRQELDAHIEDLLNPHQVTKGQIGLGNVDNTADADKPVSNSTQSAIISAVAPKSDKTYVDNQLALKANKADVYTKAETYSRQETQGLVDDKISTALFPISSEIDYIERYTPLPYKLQNYAVGQRVTLSTGEIVENRVPNNNVDPNTDMLGWVKVNSADQVFDESGLSQQEINDLSGHSRLMFKNYTDLRGYSGLGTRIFVSNKWLRGSFVFDESDTSSVDNGGTIIVDSKGRRWKREFNGAVKAYWFGAPTGVNDQVQINKAIIAAVDYKELVDLRGAAWGINGTIKFNANSSGYIAGKQSTITVASSSTYTNGYAIEIGDAAQPSGRTAGFKGQGHLFVNSTSRANALNGVFMRGSWLNVDFIRAVNFNGFGINADTVWDSTIGHLSTEVCGNSTTFALRISSNADTFNASTINTIQCEQSQGKGLGINIIRTTINTIHSERMTVINESEDHNVLILSNSTLNQAIIDSLTKNETTVIDAPGSVVNSVNCSGDVKSTFGSNHSFSGLVCKRYRQTGASKDITLNNCRIDTLKLGSGAVATNCNVATFNPEFNAEQITVIGGSVATVNYTSNIRGNICFNGTKIDSINDTREPAAGYNQTEFLGCNVNAYNGYWNAKAKFIGGSIQTANIVSQAKPTFESVEFKDFSSSGNRSYITKGCTATGSVTWNTPNFWMQAGTLTERIGYSVVGKIYQNVDGANSWNPIGSSSTSVTYDPPSIASGVSEITTVTLTGAAIGDTVIASFNRYNPNIEISAQVSAVNTVTVKFKNTGAAAVDLASGTLTVKKI